MPENDEVIEVYTSELNLMVELSAKIAAGNLQAVAAMKELADALKSYQKGATKRDEAFKAAVEGLTITNTINVPEQPAPVINVMPSEVIIKEAPEVERRKTLTITRDAQGRINGGFIE